MKTLNKTLIALSLIAGLNTATYATCSTHINMGNHRIVNVADPINAGDVVNKKYFEEVIKNIFVRDNTKEIVEHPLTNLMWQDDVAAETVTKPWLTTTNYNACDAGNSSSCTDTSGDTAATYCGNMTLGGYNDWRLPTKEELHGIVKNSAPTISGVFQHTASSYYWSSTTYAGSSSYAWNVNFYFAYQNYGSKSYSYYVRCVRNGQ